MSRVHSTLQIGERFGRLEIAGERLKVPAPCAGDPNRKIFAYPCRCECGVEKVVPYSKLASGAIKSCGCYRREIMEAERRVSKPRHGHASRNGKQSPEYKAWCHLKERCLNPTHPNWHNYGGRGITVCDDWRDSFEAFYRDMGPRPSSKHTIERVDNDAGYSKDNCIWSTRKEQANNTRKTVHHELDGETLNQSDWGRRNGISPSTISLRIKRGWSIEDAVSAPPVDHRGVRYEHDGKSLTIAEWSRETGISCKLIGQRLGSGWSVADALTMRSRQKPKVG